MMGGRERDEVWEMTIRLETLEYMTKDGDSEECLAREVEVEVLSESER